MKFIMNIILSLILLFNFSHVISENLEDKPIEIRLNKNKYKQNAIVRYTIYNPLKKNLIYKIAIEQYKSESGNKDNIPNNKWIEIIPDILEGWVPTNIDSAVFYSALVDKSDSITKESFTPPLFVPSIKRGYFYISDKIIKGKFQFLYGAGKKYRLVLYFNQIDDVWDKVNSAEFEVS